MTTQERIDRMIDEMRAAEGDLSRIYGIAEDHVRLAADDERVGCIKTAEKIGVRLAFESVTAEIGSALRDRQYGLGGTEA